MAPLVDSGWPSSMIPPPLVTKFHAALGADVERIIVGGSKGRSLRISPDKAP